MTALQGLHKYHSSAMVSQPLSKFYNTETISRNFFGIGQFLRLLGVDLFSFFCFNGIYPISQTLAPVDSHDFGR